MEMPDEKYAPVGEMFPSTSTGRRTALAQWIASKQNPRTARVAVNHIWLRHFGQALVPSVANFGLNGDQPSHPELLDWLASELMDHDWKMKPRRFASATMFSMETAEAVDSADISARVSPPRRTRSIRGLAPAGAGRPRQRPCNPIPGVTSWP